MPSIVTILRDRGLDRDRDRDRPVVAVPSLEACHPDLEHLAVPIAVDRRNLQLVGYLVDPIVAVQLVDPIVVVQLVDPIVVVQLAGPIVVVEPLGWPCRSLGFQPVACLISVRKHRWHHRRSSIL